jgi:hypothetical protein
MGVYQRGYEIYRSLYPTLRETFGGISRLS